MVLMRLYLLLINKWDPCVCKIYCYSIHSRDDKAWCKSVGFQGKSGPGKIHEVILVVYTSLIRFKQVPSTLLVQADLFQQNICHRI